MDGPSSARTPDPPGGPTRRGLVPLQSTVLVAREAELTEALRRLSQPDVRLLTLVGVPGAGKTRLATAIAVTAAACFRDGLSFVDLTPIRDSDLVRAAIGESLGLRQTGDRPLADSLRSVLREMEVLLLLDNFEHVLPAAPQIADLLTNCAGLKVLVTSRSPLHMSAEHQLEVLPLAVPDLGHLPEPHVLEHVPAVSLFNMRARAVRGDWVLSPTNARPVAEICVRLDGLPLAIELAAAWTSVLPPRALREHLATALDLPVAAARDLPIRHRTLRAAIDWSHDLLEPDERMLLRRCAVFEGGWSMEAAAAVAADAADNLLRHLAGLVNKHLISSEEATDGMPRFSMLQTVREYALHRLAAAGESDHARRQHAEFFLRLAERAEEALNGPGQRAWLDLLQREHGNLRAALDWTGSSADPRAIELGLRMGGALWFFWDMRGHAGEGQERLAALLSRAGNARPGLARVRALNAAGYLAILRTDYVAARAVLEESERLARELGDSTGLGRALAFLGMAVAMGFGELERATCLHNESLRIARAAGDTWSEGFSLYGLGHVATRLGDWTGATGHWDDCLRLVRRVGNTWAISYLQLRWGLLALARGEHARARQLLEESLQLSWQVDNVRGMALSAEGLAVLHAMTGLAERGAVLFGMAEALLELASYHLPPYLRESHELALARIRQHLAADTVLAAWSRGRTLSLTEAITFALGRQGGDQQRSAPSQQPARVLIEGLTPRERDVLARLAAGRRNAEIADELAVSTKTVEYHIGHLFEKLGARSRTEALVIARQGGLI